jgi:hypothetical protein
MRSAVAAAAMFVQLLIVHGAEACSLAPPTGDVVLSIGGMINDCNEGLEVHFDRAMIDALPKKDIKTENPWDHGSSVYEGVLLRDLMKYAKASGKTATFTALNDYRADLPLADMDRYDVILAFKRDGADLPVRDKGPFFVVFPFTDVPELASESRFAQSVWQVNRITVK